MLFLRLTASSRDVRTKTCALSLAESRAHHRSPSSSSRGCCSWFCTEAHSKEVGFGLGLWATSCSGKIPLGPLLAYRHDSQFAQDFPHAIQSFARNLMVREFAWMTGSSLGLPRAPAEPGGSPCCGWPQRFPAQGFVADGSLNPFDILKTRTPSHTPFL